MRRNTILLSLLLVGFVEPVADSAVEGLVVYRLGQVLVDTCDVQQGLVVTDHFRRQCDDR